MSRYSDLLTSETPQSAPLGRTSSYETKAQQVKNDAGGFVFQIANAKRLERFLILGSDAPTYYASAKKLTKDNAGVVNECWTADPIETANIIRDISVEGRAPKNSPAIFACALGVVHKDKQVRSLAFTTASEVCRTSTHLFEFVDTCRSLGKGWGRGMKTMVADWYNNKTDDQLAYQIVKYRQREGYTHERLIRLSHPTMPNTSDARRAIYDWLRKRVAVEYHTSLPGIIRAHERCMVATEDELKDLVYAIAAHKLPWEALPTWANTKHQVWWQMLDNKMPLNALMRNLGNMTRLNVFNSGFAVHSVMEAFRPENIRKARLHPFNILNALSTYKSGQGFRGTNNWTPLNEISVALEGAFYDSFQFVKPSNSKILIALDVSSSMDSKMNNSNLSVREASAAMSMVTMATEEHCDIVGFTSLRQHNSGRAVMPLEIYRGMELEQIIRYTKSLPFSGTDCALPMLWAMENNKQYDAIVIYTDSETWAGNIHPVEALKRYRERYGLDTKLVVVGMTSTGFSIADPNDTGMLDVVGFDTAAPSVISNFIGNVETSPMSEQHEE